MCNDENKNNGRDKKEIHEFHKHYRGAAVALSAAALTTCGALIYWLSTVLGKSPTTRTIFFIGGSHLALGASFLGFLFVQFFNVKGYMHLARWSYSNSQKEFDASQRHFDRLDSCLTFFFWVFIVALIFVALLYLQKIGT